MKTTKLILLTFALTWSVGLAAQSRSETISKTLKFEQTNANNVLYLANVNGNITVEGYNGSEIRVEAIKKVSAKTEARLEAAFGEVEVGVLDRMDTIFLYVKGVCGQFGFQTQRWSDEPRRWGYDWNNCEQSFDYKIDFKIQVPSSINVYASTINDGDVLIAGMNSSISAKNINGSIEVKEAQNLVYAHTINGDVDIDCQSLPAKKARYYTLNGDINFNYPRNLSAEFSFKSYNGEMFTNIPDLTYLPPQIEKKESKGDRGIKYELDGKTVIKARNGGVRLDFETFNGDVYVKENIN